MKQNKLTHNKLTHNRVTHYVNSDNRLAEIIRFGMVGGFATVLQFGVYVIFVDAVGLGAEISTTISYAISFVFNYFLTSAFTFKEKRTAKNGLGFALSHLINWGLQTAMVAIFKGIVGDTLALLPALAICIPCNYLLVRFAFKHLNKKN